MKKILVILSLLLLILSTSAGAAITLPFSSSFSTGGQCAEWEWSSGTVNPTCDGWGRRLDGTFGGHGEMITSPANNSAGGGGRGNRHWTGTGKNHGTGGLSLSFSSTQNEIWVRFYKRWGSGFGWSPLQEDKMVWLGGTSGDPATAIFSLSGNTFRFWNQNQSTPAGNNTKYGTANTGWNNFMGGSTSDGAWHCFEFHVKMNSSPGVYDGIEQAWVDGVLVLNTTNVNLGGGSGWNTIGFNINSDYAVPVGGVQEVDLDDVAISNTGYIGLLDGGGGGEDNTPPPTTPTGLSATAVSSSQINLSWTASTDAVAVSGYNIYRDNNMIGVMARGNSRGKKNGENFIIWIRTRGWRFFDLR